MFLCLIAFQLDLANAGSLKQLWNKLRYDNQRLDLDYYQPYSSFNYLPSSSVNYPSIASLNNFNLMNAPLAESSNLHRTVVSYPTGSNLPSTSDLQSSLQNSLQNSLQGNLATSSSNLQANSLPNLMTSESINNQHLSILPQQMPMQHLSPEFLYDFGQKPNQFNSMDPLRNLNNLQTMNPGLSLTSLTPLLLLSSLGTLSSKSLANSGGSPLAPTVSTSFLKGLTTYLSSYLPSSPRQRKRQIDRTLPSFNPNSYAFKKMTPIEPFVFQPSLNPLNSQFKTSSNNYDASFSKKYSRFNKKKPVKYVKPKWITENKMKKPYNMKKQKNQIKYSKLMYESGFLNRPNMTNNTRFKQSQQPSNKQIKYSEPDKLANESNKAVDNEKESTNNQNNTKLTEDKQATNRSTDLNDKINEKVNKSNEKSNEKSTEENAATEEGHHSIELTSNQPQQTDNLEDFAEKMYR